MNGRERWQRHGRETAHRHRRQAPADQNDHHQRGELHDAQRFLAGFVNADDILAPEINGHGDGENCRKRLRLNLEAGMAGELRAVVD